VIAYSRVASRLSRVRGEFAGVASEFSGTLAKERHVRWGLSRLGEDSA